MEQINQDLERIRRVSSPDKSRQEASQRHDSEPLADITRELGIIGPYESKERIDERVEPQPLHTPRCGVRLFLHEAVLVDGGEQPRVVVAVVLDEHWLYELTHEETRRCAHLVVFVFHVLE